MVEKLNFLRLIHGRKTGSLRTTCWGSTVVTWVASSKSFRRKRRKENCPKTPGRSYSIGGSYTTNGHTLQYAHPFSNVLEWSLHKNSELEQVYIHGIEKFSFYCFLFIRNNAVTLLGISQETEKVALAETTGLDQKQINNWFINQRKRHWKPSEDMQFMVMDGLHPQNAALYMESHYMGDGGYRLGPWMKSGQGGIETSTT